MPQNKLPNIPQISDEIKTVLRFILDKAIRSIYAELNILCQRCLGYIGSGDQRAIILDRYHLWQSCIIVMKEILRGKDVPESVGQAFEDMRRLIEDLRDAFVNLASVRQNNKGARISICERFKKVFRELSVTIQQIDVALDLGTRFIKEKNNLARISGERSLNWLCSELQRADQ